MTNTREERVARALDEIRTALHEHCGNRPDCQLCRVYDHVNAAYGEAIGEPVEPSPDVWEAIETAPKDGTAILLAVRGCHPRRPNANGMFVTAGRWLWSKDARLPHEEYPHDGGFLELNNNWDDEWGGNISDRFWKPMPDPPKVTVEPQDTGVTPTGSGYSAEPEPSCTVSAVPVSIPNAALYHALDNLLATCGARGRYHALEYADAVDAAEAVLATAQGGA